MQILSQESEIIVENFFKIENSLDVLHWRKKSMTLKCMQNKFIHWHSFLFLKKHLFLTQVC